MDAPVQTQPDAPEDSGPPYPTFQECQQSGKLPRYSKTGGELLFWSIKGPLETAISVMTSPTTVDRLEPYFDAATASWHPVSKMPICEPKASSITVHVSALEDWEMSWEDMHWEHSDDMPNELSIATWARLDDDFPEGQDKNQNKNEEEHNDDDDDDDDDNHHGLRPIKCCGILRPRNKNVSLVVTPAQAAGDGGGFVTVHDYVSAVHPWLVSLRDDIRHAMGDLEDDIPLPEETDLMVCTYTVDSIWIKSREDLIFSLTGQHSTRMVNIPVDGLPQTVYF